MIQRRLDVAMTSASKSLFVFALYVLLLGTAFIVTPAAVVRVLALPALPIGWGRRSGPSI